MNRYNLRKRPTTANMIWQAAETLPKSYEAFPLVMLDTCKKYDCALDHKYSRRLALVASKLKKLRFDRHRYPTSHRYHERYRKQFVTRDPNFDKLPFDPQAMLDAFISVKNESIFNHAHYVDEFCPLHLIMQATAEMLWVLEKNLEPNRKIVKAFKKKFRDGTHDYKRVNLCRHLGYYSYTRHDILTIRKEYNYAQIESKDGDTDSTTTTAPAN